MKFQCHQSAQGLITEPSVESHSVTLAVMSWTCSVSVLSIRVLHRHPQCFSLSSGGFFSSSALWSFSSFKCQNFWSSLVQECSLSKPGSALQRPKSPGERWRRPEQEQGVSDWGTGERECLSQTREPHISWWRRILLLCKEHQLVWEGQCDPGGKRYDKIHSTLCRLLAFFWFLFTLNSICFPQH